MLCYQDLLQTCYGGRATKGLERDHDPQLQKPLELRLFPHRQALESLKTTSPNSWTWPFPLFGLLRQTKLAVTFQMLQSKAKQSKKRRL